MWLNGLVYVGGGDGFRWKCSYDINSYDPDKNSWNSPINTPYCHFAMATLNNNLVIAGGRDKDQNKTKEILIMDAGQLKNYTNMITARSYITAAGHQEMLIISGGRDDKNEMVSSTEIFDSNERKWYCCSHGDLPQPHSSLKSVIVDDTLYLLGGFNKNGEPSPVMFAAQLKHLSRHELQ